MDHPTQEHRAPGENEDPMAVEKTLDAIRKFSADIRKLKNILKQAFENGTPRWG